MSLRTQTDSLHVPLAAAPSPANANSATPIISLQQAEHQQPHQQQTLSVKCANRCAPCCFDHPALWRSSPCDCCSRFFIRHLVLFEDRSIEAMYLRHAKITKRARIVPSIVTALGGSVSTILTAAVIADAVVTDYWHLLSISLAAAATAVVVLTIVGLAISCAQKCAKRVRYQLQAATLGIAVAVSTAAAVGGSAFLRGSHSGSISVIGLLWVCHKALVMSDVVAARVLVAVVPFNVTVLLACVVVGLYFLASLDHLDWATMVLAAFELGTSLVASSGVLLWLALQHESASRSLFYWSRIVDANVDTLDAEANPFHPSRLLDWVSRANTDVEMVPHNSSSSQESHRFWELDGARLRLDSTVAAGGGGVVWKAAYGNKIVAAKQLYTNLRSGSEQLEELATEVSVLAQLSHPHIVRFLGLCRHASESTGRDTGYLPLFIVQEYCPTNLRAMLTDVLPAMAPFDWQPEVRRVASEIANAMQYLHGCKVLHRDLKPENVLLTDDLTVRVADFGVSLQFMDGANSAEDDLCGTPAYMPPEMLCGRSDASAVGDEQHVDGMASDVYAFGVIVCELLLSKSEFGILDTLVVNGGTNRKLGQVARSASDSDSMQRQWKFPPFPNDHNAPVCHYSDLGCRCCSFYPGERPSFTEVYVALNPSNDNAALASEMPQQAAGALKHSSRRLRSVSHASSEMGDSAVVASMTRPPPKLSAASIEVNVDAEIEQRTQIVVDKCGWRCWSRHGLRFANNDMEHRFLAFMHSDDFFRYLRWPYVVLAALQLVFMMAMFATNQPENAAHPFVSTALFSSGWPCPTVLSINMGTGVFLQMPLLIKVETR